MRILGNEPKAIGSLHVEEMNQSDSESYSRKIKSFSSFCFDSICLYFITQMDSTIHGIYRKFRIRSADRIKHVKLVKRVKCRIGTSFGSRQFWLSSYEKH